MKKYFALILCALTVLTCFTACAPKAELVDGYAAVTKEDGGVIRDQAGNIIVHVTDENGRQVEGEDGEYVTTPIALEHPIVVGRRIEAPDYAINIPDGWSDKLTEADLDIMKDGTKDNLRILVLRDTTLNDVLESRAATINTLMKNFPSAEFGTKSVTVGDGISAQYTYGYVDDTGVREDDGKGNLTVISSFFGFIMFENNGDIYCCSLTSNRNMNENIDEILGILGTIEFI
ncbi:MAG: hypothetical protein IJO03_00910 [Clostridia bacterium]|nr:hypothetical protein [Clostridia bacterium]MBQ7120799.1 hypothetical protein [Clostridia bacterium]